MTQFFCAEASRLTQEDIIGSASNYSTYILIEWPTPWAPNAFDSQAIPENLKQLVGEVKRTNPSVQFLLIAPHQSKPINQTKVLIYDQSREKEKGEGEGWLKNRSQVPTFKRGVPSSSILSLPDKEYRKKEFNVENCDRLATVISTYLAGEDPDCVSETSETRDILICTHGSHDRCCARYGNPFYRKALAAVCDLSLSHVRIWKASHFGGHRFAPTAIDLPEGRYYGVLDPESFRSILTRTGNIEALRKVYRGWGILPNPVQILERELMLRYGWDWLNYRVAGRILAANSANNGFCAEVTFQKPDGSLYSYQAELIKDESKTLNLKGSCNAMKVSEFVKYSVENLNLCHYTEPVANLPVYVGKRAS
ncbi:MAG TPA: sucrase ferredoxin [Cyanobacteria bacterium UBA8803]|nr:sucrase ferredoxin [Cyanobacteria bacterium UBA9273]HBL57168.1 sucrase ferredoxin [Cyanobacteria bacterium UBA8803]